MLPRPRLKPLTRVLSQRPLPLLSIGPSSSSQTRQVSLSSSSHDTLDSSSSEELLKPPPSRWYSDLRGRIGKCIMSGCTEEQAQRAAGMLRILATEWRELTAGAEGFLTGRRRGLESQQVVWGEMDSFGHVNNANYIRYAESARVNWILHFAGKYPEYSFEWNNLMKPLGVGLILQSIKAEYKVPITYPDTVSAYHKLSCRPSESDTSLMLQCIILSHRHRRVAARTEELIVMYNYREASRTVIPSFALEAFLDVWERQQDEAKKAQARIWQLISEVQELEQETCDPESRI